MTDIGLGTDARVCPRCGAAIRPVPMLYGYPTHEAFEAHERGEIRLGGCVVGDESPEYACPACDAMLPWADGADGADWAGPPARDR